MVNIFEYLISDPYQVSQFTADVDVIILFARFICGTILHLSLIDEVSTGLDNMKFCLNHSYLFQSWKYAWLVGFLQCLIVIMVEIVNIQIILTSTNPVDIVYNFIALAIIAEFDDFVYAALRNESMKKLIEKEVTDAVLVIRHTTSKKCGDNELSTVKDQDGEFRPLRIQFKNREPINKCMYCTYKCFRTFYVSVYFYFMPFTTIILTCLIPIFNSFQQG